jgi:hypothetical protein
MPGAWRKADLALVAGCAISLAAWISARLLLRLPPDASDASPEDIRSVWAGWVSYYDMHRRPPGLNSLLMTVGFVLLAYASMFGGRVLKSANSRPWIVCIVYCGVALVIVLAVVLAQSLLGADIPFVLLSWLPYRLWNHVPPVMLAMICAILLPPRTSLLDAQGLAGYGAVSLMLGLTFLSPLLMDLLPASIAYRYLGTLDIVVFFLFGAAYALVLWEMHNRSRRLVVIFGCIGAVLLLVLALVHQFGAVSTIAGTLVPVLLSRMRSLPPIGPWAPRVVAAIVACLIASLTWTESRLRQSLPVGGFEAAVAEKLASSSESDAMLLGPMDQVLLQAQTDHPVLTDLATPFCSIAYRPSTGPKVNEMYRDLYGADFRFPVPPRPWKQVWTERTPGEWTQLAAKYDFHYVVAPEDTPVQLPVELDHFGRKLYRVAPQP